MRRPLSKKCEDKPFEQYWSLEPEHDAMETMEHQKDRVLSTLGWEPEDLGEAEKAMDEVLIELRNNEKKQKYLAPKLKDAPMSDLGTQMQVMQDVAVETQEEISVETQVAVAVSQEVQTESHLYRGSCEEGEEVKISWPQRPRADQILQTTPLKSLSLKDWIVEDKEPPRIKLCDLIQTEYELSGVRAKERKNYTSIFDDNILVTANFAFSEDMLRPILAETQKPAMHILAVREGEQKMNFVLLAEEEARQFQSWFQESQDDNMWLFQPNGYLYHSGSESPPPDPEGLLGKQIQRALIQANVLCGNLIALNHQFKETEQWLNDGNTELKRRFLDIKSTMGGEGQVLYV